MVGCSVILLGLNQEAAEIVAGFAVVGAGLKAFFVIGAGKVEISHLFESVGSKEVGRRFAFGEKAFTGFDEAFPFPGGGEFVELQFPIVGAGWFCERPEEGLGGADAFFSDRIAWGTGFDAAEDFESVLRLIEMEAADAESECGFCPIRVEFDFRLKEVCTLLPQLETLHTGDGLNEEIGTGRD